MSQYPYCMNKMQRKRLKQKLAEIERILWEEWDPIGVNDCTEAFGEYDSYALQICGMLQSPATSSAVEVEAFLTKIRTRSMGLSAVPDHDQTIAKRLLSLQAPLRITND